MGDGMRSPKPTPLGRGVKPNSAGAAPPPPAAKPVPEPQFSKPDQPVPAHTLTYPESGLVAGDDVQLGQSSGRLRIAFTISYSEDAANVVADLSRALCTPATTQDERDARTHLIAGSMVRLGLWRAAEIRD